MKTVTLSCDSCSKTVNIDGTGRSGGWAEVRLWRVSGFGRVEKKYDVCPFCQDLVAEVMQKAPTEKPATEDREWHKMIRDPYVTPTTERCVPNPVDRYDGIGSCDICGHKGAVVSLDFKNHAGGNPATFRHYACPRCLQLP